MIRNDPEWSGMIWNDLKLSEMFSRKSLRHFSGTLPKIQLKRSILEQEIPTGGVWKDYQLSIIHRSFPNSPRKRFVWERTCSWSSASEYLFVPAESPAWLKFYWMIEFIAETQQGRKCVNFLASPSALRISSSTINLKSPKLCALWITL